MEKDKETQEVLRKGKKYYDLAKSEDWSFAKSILNDKIKTLDSLSTLPTDLSLEDQIKEIQIRRGATELVETWIKEIEDSAEVHIENLQATQEGEEQIIVRLDE